MISPIVKWIIKRTFAQLSRGDWESVLSGFDANARFVMLGSTKLSAELHGREAIRTWFARVYEMLPDFGFDPHVIAVSGPAWRMNVATQFTVSGTFPDGSRYENNAMQMLTLRWGKVVEDFLVEDTHRLADAIERLADQGVEAAKAPPFGPLPVMASARGR